MKKVGQFLKKYYKHIINVILITFISIYVPCVAINKAKDYEIYKEPEIETKIYTIWHVETFEGGGKARVDYLKNIARSMEKQHDGVLFMIKSIDPDKLADEIAVSTPDIISFGYGVGNVVLDKLIPFSTSYNVRDELVESGSYSNKLYAIPYIISGYAMITHENESGEFHCGASNYINPKTIYTSLNLSPCLNETSFEAYKNFVYNSSDSLLGTGRDVYRVNNLNNIGRTNATITPIDSYTDLIQYVGKTTSDDIIEEFINSIFDDNNQLSLTNYSLFSSKYTKLYSNGIYKDMEEAIAKCDVPNVFSA